MFCFLDLGLKPNFVDESFGLLEHGMMSSSQGTQKELLLLLEKSDGGSVADQKQKEHHCFGVLRVGDL